VHETLPALRAQLRDGDQLIVVDNGSTDGTPDAVRELAPEATLIEAGANLGFGAGCNRGPRPRPASWSCS
jgi:GT2 family glycosyltransferase